MNIASRYIDLLKQALANELYIELEAQLVYAIVCASHHETPDLDQLTAARDDSALIEHLRSLKCDGDTLLLKGLDHQGRSVPDASLRNHSEFPHTLIGHKRLDNLQHCIETACREGIEGDILEAGCWRGGAAIFMRGVLEALEEKSRTVWVADSFEGLPRSSDPRDQGFEMDASVSPVLSVSLDAVKENFRRYGLLDQRVEFIQGWFEESLVEKPEAPLAVLHIDADLYVSTRDVLENCYSRVSPGGFVVVDDYGILPPCRDAVDEFIVRNNLSVDLKMAGRHAVFWRKGA